MRNSGKQRQDDQRHNSSSGVGPIHVGPIHICVGAVRLIMMKTMRSGLRMILAIAGLLASGFGQDDLAHQRACDCIEAVCLQGNLTLLSDSHVRIDVHIIIGH